MGHPRASGMNIRGSYSLLSSDWFWGEHGLTKEMKEEAWHPSPVGNAKAAASCRLGTLDLKLLPPFCNPEATSVTMKSQQGPGWQNKISHEPGFSTVSLRHRVPAQL